ncbi:hypothetical protein BHE74_00006323 [Ensete ventricosum]|nr:hypothetical protein BHE74_00006323 [Ensete ventricosum]
MQEQVYDKYDSRNDEIEPDLRAAVRLVPPGTYRSGSSPVLRTGRYRAVSLKSTVGGRLRQKSTVDCRLRKKKGRGRRRRGKEERIRRGEEEIPRLRALAARGRLFSPRRVRDRGDISNGAHKVVRHTRQQGSYKSFELSKA